MKIQQGEQGFVELGIMRCSIHWNHCKNTPEKELVFVMVYKKRYLFAPCLCTYKARM